MRLVLQFALPQSVQDSPRNRHRIVAFGPLSVFGTVVVVEFLRRGRIGGHMAAARAGKRRGNAPAPVQFDVSPRLNERFHPAAAGAVPVRNFEA